MAFWIALATLLNLGFGGLEDVGAAPRGAMFVLFILATWAAAVGPGRASMEADDWPPPLSLRLDGPVLGALVLISLAAHLWDLGRWPPYLTLDEGINAQAVNDILEGRQDSLTMYSAAAGEEAAAFYLQAFAVWFAGPGVAALRVSNALLSAAAAPALYLLTRVFTRPLAALLCCGLFCLSPWQLYFGRIGNNIGQAGTFLILVLAAAERWLRTARREWALLAGLALGLGLHTYPQFRVVPLMMLGLLLGAGRVAGLSGGTRLRAAGWMVLVALLLYAPVLREAMENQEYYRRPLRLSLFSEGLARGLASVPAAALSAVGVGLSLWPTETGIGLLHALLAALALLGLLATPRAIRSRMWLVLAWPLVVGSIPPVVLEFQSLAPRRFILVAPLLFALAAVGLERILSLAIRQGRRTRQLSEGLLLAVALLAVVPSQWSAFHRVATRPETATDAILDLRAALERVGPDATLMLPFEEFHIPFVLQERDQSPNLDYLLQDSRVELYRGGNVYPLRPPGSPVAYWMRSAQPDEKLARLFPGGRSTPVSPWPGGPVQGAHLYTVGPETAFAHQGLTFRSLGPSGEVLDGPLRVEEPGQLPGSLAETAVLWEWTGALHLPRSCVARFSWEGEPGRRLTLALGEGVAIEGRGRADGAFRLGEGFHPLRLTSTAGPPSRGGRLLRWATGEGGGLVPVPGWRCVGKMPGEAALRGRGPAPEPPGSLDHEVGFYWTENPLHELATDVVDWRGSTFLMVGGTWSVLRLDTMMSPIPGWRGLRAEDGGGLGLPRLPDFQAFLQGMDALPDGGLVVASGIDARVMLFGPDGAWKGRLGTPYSFSRPVDVAWDPVGERYLVADPGRGQVVVVERDGAVRETWPASRAYALAVDRRGRTILAEEGRGGLSVRGRDGREVAFYRLDDVSALSRLAVDEEGRLYHLAPARRRITVLDAEGRLLSPPLLLPPLRETRRGPQRVFYTGLWAGGDGDVLLSFGQPVNGVRRFRYRQKQAGTYAFFEECAEVDPPYPGQPRRE